MQQGVKILEYDFQGPWNLGTAFKDVPGVYVIYTSSLWLDVGQTNALGSRLNGNNHDRRRQWISASGGLPIKIAFMGVTDPIRRTAIESNLRTRLNPVCGER